MSFPLTVLLNYSPGSEYAQRVGSCGRRECFQLGEYQELTRPATLFLPPGEDRQSWAPCTVSALCISRCGSQPRRISREKDMKWIRKRGPNYISDACLKMFQQNLSSQMTMHLSKLSTRLIFCWAKEDKNVSIMQNNADVCMSTQLKRCWVGPKYMPSMDDGTKHCVLCAD